jgi:hypothetical protein
MMVNEIGVKRKMEQNNITAKNYTLTTGTVAKSI